MNYRWEEASESSTISVWRMLGAALAAAIITAGIGVLLGLVVFDKSGRFAYGYLLFLGLPLFQGYLASIFLKPEPLHQGRHYITTSILSVGMSGLGLLCFGAEGVVCIVMAIPLVVPLAIGGAYIGHTLRSRGGGGAFGFVWIVPVAFLSFQRVTPVPQETRIVSTEVLIHADSARIWPMVRELRAIPESGFWLFRLGVAHPYRAEMLGPSARVCRLTTGDMFETVTVDESPRLFRFAVLNTPASMKEMNPFHDVKANHLNGNYECEWGQFEFIPQPGGWTLLRGTSCYHYRMGPAWYWNLWTDKIVHEVHESVLGEIKRKAEKSSLN